MTKIILTSPAAAVARRELTAQDAADAVTGLFAHGAEVENLQ